MGPSPTWIKGDVIRIIGRGGGRRKQKNLVVIVTQGKKTEPIYFNHFKGIKSNYSLIIKPLANDPISLIDYAKNLMDEQFDFGPRDKLFCVYDVNSTPEAQLVEAKNRAKKLVIRVCVSNPCFELWYLLHFILHASCIDSYSDIKVELLKYISNYDKDKDVFVQLQSKQHFAISNAKRLDAHHEREKTDSIRRRNPSTQVHNIVEYLNKLE